jgi:hypothetical protein
MPNFLQGLAGAATGFLTGGPAGALVGGISGLEGQGSREDPQMKQQRLFQQNIANQFMQQANAVPGSDPYSMAALSQDRGALGAAQRQSQQQVMGAWNPQQGTNGLADMMRNLANNQVGQQMSLQESHLFNALSQRQQALMNAANAGGKAAAMYQPRQSQLSTLLGQLAQQIAYRQQQGKGKGTGEGGSVYGGDQTVDPASVQDWQRQKFQGPAAPTTGVPGTTPPTDNTANAGAPPYYGGPFAPGLPAPPPGQAAPGPTAAAPADPFGVGNVRNPSTVPAINFGNSPFLRMGDDPAMTQALQSGPLPPTPQAQINGMNTYNTSGLAALNNQIRQSNQQPGVMGSVPPAGQRFIHLPGGLKMPY